MAKLFLVLFVITALLLHEGETLRCWFCHSSAMGESGCADPFRGSSDIVDDKMVYSRDCDQLNMFLHLIPGATHFIPAEKVINDSGLVLVCYKLTGLSLGAPVVMRGCAAGMPNVTETSCMSIEPQNQTGGRILTCYACSGDFCNGAADVGSAAILFFVTLLLLVTTVS